MNYSLKDVATNNFFDEEKFIQFCRINFTSNSFNWEKNEPMTCTFYVDKLLTEYRKFRGNEFEVERKINIEKYKTRFEEVGR